MATELKGRVKESEWTRPHCKDESDPLSLRRLARKDFQQDARGEDCDRGRGERPRDVASADMIGEANELGDS